MRFLGFAVVSSAIVLGACSGGGEKAADSAATAVPAATDTAATAAATTPGTAGTAAAITGTTHEVKMVGDDKGYRFEPADIKVKAGDGIKFIMVSGGPHNVAFDPATIPADVKGQLSANMPSQQGELSSPLFSNPNENYIISFANIKPGQYPYHCTPHLAMGMKGTITVQ
ncbi:MAG TPA: plastocyanin/azurin family copper-binding protein [Gemmatimonadaceae bacterium]|nr:plastocyanin/azurin family copper-binding protein [Gemmatimonadaceae bacterium]